MPNRNRPAQPIDLETFLASLRDRTASGVSEIAFDGDALPVSVALQDTPAVIFTFIGAIDRERLRLPRFAATTLHQHVPASIIALADPTLARSDDLTLAWYAGHEDLRLQSSLPRFLQQVVDALGATRVAFVGSSGGGFAALYYSWHLPGSIAVVSNPQTNLDSYIRAHRRRYITTCWPGFDKDESLSTVIDADLAPIYASRCDNTVVYLQVASDFFHVARHFAPFADALPREYGNRFVVRMANWGRRGHHPVPTNIWIPWMTAALTAPNTTAQSIEDTWDAQHPYQLPALEPLARPANREEEIAADIARTATSALLNAEPAGMRRS